MKYLPNREECQQILSKTDAFYCEEREVNGFKVEMYCYRLASHSDFSDYNAYELRGLTFVYNPTTETWERHLLLDKFFNYSQAIGWMPEDLDNKKIVRVQEKLDGSVISFITFPDGSVRAKSKMSFDSEQAQMAQEVYNNNMDIKVAVFRANSNGETLIFELTSPDNHIVVDYEKTELTLLQVRNKDGEYSLSLEPYKTFYGLKIPKPNTLSLQELLALKASCKDNIEGWIVTFEDGQMAKVKTDHYLSLHGLIGPDAFRENLLIATILNDSIDDVIAALPEGQKKDKIDDLAVKVQHKFNHLIQLFYSLHTAYYKDYSQDRKSFALDWSKSEIFPCLSRKLNTIVLSENEVREEVKHFILRKTKTLSSAKEWLRGL